MPHMHIKSFKEVSYPFNHNGVDFLFQANCDDGNSLIAVDYKNKEFFINLKSGDKNLIKADKTTRPNPNHILKEAMNAYASYLDLEILDSNINNTTINMHLESIRGLRYIDDFSDKFIDNEFVSIEVGFGSGRHLLHQAKQNPNMFFIGLEIHKPSLEQVLKQIEIQNLDNIVVLDYDARLFLELVPSNRIDKIFVHFPVPWDKKPHRRVISEAFLNEANRVLKAGGNLELRTDSENYYSYALEVYSSPNKSEFYVKKNQDIEISSKYEDRWKKMSKNIYDVIFTSNEISAQLDNSGDFRFSNEIDNKNLIKLPTSSVVKDWGFVRVEKKFIIDDNRALIRVSMGGFDRPENLYVFLEKDKSKYYPFAPVKSQTNFKAHKLLDEILNG